MKTHRLLKCLAAALIAPAGAATVISDYDNSTGPGDPGFPYIDKVIMSVTDSWSDSITPGGWSYKNLAGAANPNQGWGHTSRWFLIELTGTADVTVSMSSADSSAWAGFVIYAGESIDDVPSAAHTFSNNGLEIAALNGGWDKNGPGGTPGLVYVGHAHESAPSPSASGTWTLGPGLYTIAFGNAADSGTAPTAKTFSLAITTVPEPSAALLSFLAAGALGLRRRRA